MGTTSSSGLNNLLSSTNQSQTTLPSWYDTAQQNVINNANTALGNAPTLGQTTAQNAINTLNSTTNPFTSAESSLSSIASGAANPFNVDPTTGAVTPNTSTAMGGLFQAQQNQLNQLLPTLTSGTEAGAIGSGNFGSLRGQTAVDTAKENALANLQASQLTSALQNQSTGSSAAANLANTGTADINANLTTGQAQLNAPFQGALNYANLVNATNAPATVSVQNQQSPLQMISTLAGLPTTGTNLLNSIFGTSATGVSGTSGYQPATTGLIGALNNAFGSGTTGATGTSSTATSSLPSPGSTGALTSQVVPAGVTVDPTTGMGSDGIDYSETLI